MLGVVADIESRGVGKIRFAAGREVPDKVVLFSSTELKDGLQFNYELRGRLVSFDLVETDKGLRDKHPADKLIAAVFVRH